MTPSALQETSGTESQVQFYVGIDTHAETHTIAVLDATGRTVETSTHAATPAGYRGVVNALNGFAGPNQVSVGVEGTNSYGAGLTRALQAGGFTVFEVLRPTRQVRRMDGKSDPIDAVEAARSLMSGRGISVPKTSTGPAQRLRYLNAARDKYVSIMTALSCSILSLLVTAPEAIREKFSQDTTAKTLTLLAQCRPGKLDPTGTDFYVLTALKSMARTHQDIKKTAKVLEQQMKAIIEEHYPALSKVHGVGTITATSLAVTAGDNPERIHSEAAFAKLCGACPIPASSGRTNRHRLNRGGDRRGNKEEILRQLKRALCREIYRALTRPVATKPTSGADLRAWRTTKGISQTQAAQALQTWPARISDIETDRRPLLTLRTQYQNWLQAA